MPRVRVHNLSVSLDGFGTGEGQSLDTPVGGLDVRLGGGATTIRQFLAADLVEATPYPSGVVHLTFSRRAVDVGPV
jgi:hypothetical protein